MYQKTIFTTAIALIAALFLTSCSPSSSPTAKDETSDKAVPDFVVSHPETDFSFWLGMEEDEFTALQEKNLQDYLQVSAGVSFYNGQVASIRLTALSGWNVNKVLDETLTVDDVTEMYGQPYEVTESPLTPSMVDYFYYLDGEGKSIDNRNEASMSLQFGFIDDKPSVIVATYIPKEENLPKLTHPDGRTFEWSTPLAEILTLLGEEPTVDHSGVFFEYLYQFPEEGIEFTASGPVLRSVMLKSTSKWTFTQTDGSAIDESLSFDAAGAMATEEDAYLQLSFLGEENPIWMAWRFDNRVMYELE